MSKFPLISINEDKFYYCGEWLIKGWITLAKYPHYKWNFPVYKNIGINNLNKLKELINNNN